MNKCDFYISISQVAEYISSFWKEGCIDECNVLFSLCYGSSWINDNTKLKYDSRYNVIRIVRKAKTGRMRTSVKIDLWKIGFSPLLAKAAGISYYFANSSIALHEDCEVFVNYNPNKSESDKLYISKKEDDICVISGYVILYLIEGLENSSRTFISNIIYSYIAMELSSLK